MTGPNDEMAARLRKLEDLEEIRNLKLTWGRLLDSKDYAAMADLFHEDGEFIAPLGTAKGREAIHAALNGRLESIAIRTSS